MIEADILPDAPVPTRQPTSPTRQAGEPWRVLAQHYPRASARPTHQHLTAQLVFTTSGMLRVQTATSHWIVLPQRALWIPPQHDHAIEVISATELRTVYFEPALVMQCGGFDRCEQVHAVEPSELTRTLVLGLFDAQRSQTMRAQMASLLLHAVSEAACSPTTLAMPRDELLHRVLMRLLAAGPSSRQWQRHLDDLAAEVAMSSRTFTRRFTADVGMSFRAWRQQARLLSSFELLSSNKPIKAIATTLGFSSSSTYVAAFREAFGITPEAWRTSSDASQG